MRCCYGPLRHLDCFPEGWLVQVRDIDGNPHFLCFLDELSPEVRETCFLLRVLEPCSGAELVGISPCHCEHAQALVVRFPEQVQVPVDPAGSFELENGADFSLVFCTLEILPLRDVKKLVLGIFNLAFSYT